VAQKKIIKVRKNDEGDITHVLFKGNKKVTPLNQAVPMAERGEIEGVHAVKGKYLRSNPDGEQSNNLDERPEV